MAVNKITFAISNMHQWAEFTEGLENPNNIYNVKIFNLKDPFFMTKTFIYNFFNSLK